MSTELKSDADIRRERRIRAMNFREMYLLPRFVEESDGTRRKLEAGEFDARSKLYPLSASIKELSDFGIGIGMYFRTLMYFGMLMFGCALFQLPTAVYFNSRSYDLQNSKDQTWKVGGSASCLSEERVCLNADCTSYAGEHHYPSKTIPRFSHNYQKSYFASDASKTVSWRDDAKQYYDDDTSPSIKDFGYSVSSARAKIVSSRDKLTVGLRTCKLRYWFGVTDFVMMIFILLVLVLVGRQQNKEAEKIDLSEQTAQDYSIVIEDPNPEILDPDVWKAWFEENFGSVFMVTVCLNNGPLLSLYKKKCFLEHELFLEMEDEEKYKANKLRTSARDEDQLAQLNQLSDSKPFFKRIMEYMGFDKTLDYFEKELIKVNIDIFERQKVEYRATKVFITFNTEQSQRECLNQMCIGALPALLDWKDRLDSKYIFRGNLLSVKEAAEPSSIIYENLDVGFSAFCKEQVISWSALGVGLICCYFSINACFENGQPALGAILISFWNALLPMMNKVLVVSFERHHTLDDLENSFISKTVAARTFCSALILYTVGIGHSQQMISPYFIGCIQSVLLADALTSPAIRVLDISGRVNRWVFAPMSGTDARAKALNQGTDYLLSERYTDLVKTVLMSLFYSALFPLGFWYSCLACFTNFWVDKYCLLRIFRQKPPSSDKLVRITRTFAAIVVLIHCVITAHFYYGWPYSNLCEDKSTELSTTGQANAVFLGALNAVYYQCYSSSSSLLPPTKVEPWFQDDGYQYKLVAFYNVIAVLTLIYICVVYFGASVTESIASLFVHIPSGVGDPQEITFDSLGTNENVEGYVPQFSVQGLNHSVLCCVAPMDNLNGGLEFSTELLNWRASKEILSSENPEDMQSHDNFTAEEKDAIYRKYNVYFDDQAKSLDVEKRNSGLLSHAKSYIDLKVDISRNVLQTNHSRMVDSGDIVGGFQMRSRDIGVSNQDDQIKWSFARETFGDIEMPTTSDEPLDLSAVAELAAAHEETDEAPNESTGQYPSSVLQYRKYE